MTLNIVNEITNILNKYGESISLRLKGSMAEKGLMASGQTASSIEYKVSEQDFKTILSILSSIALPALQTGRKPTSKGSGSGPSLRSQIRAWIDVKGIVPDDPKISKNSLAFLIARKIHKFGIKVPNQHNPGGVISDVVNDQLISEMMTEVKQATKNQAIEITKSVISLSKTSF